MARGRLITIEGIDGAGKTTLASALLDALRARGLDVLLLREPGGVAAAERIRDVVIDPDLHVAARTEALLYAAARAQLVEEAIEPLLRDGRWVLLDRFIDSSLAYQGGGRELGIDSGPGDQRVRDPDGVAGSHAALDDRLRARAEPLAVARGGSRSTRARAERILRPDGGRVPRARCRGPRADPEGRCHAPARRGARRGARRACRPTLSSRSDAPARTPRRRRPSPRAPACAASSRAPSGSGRSRRRASAGHRDGGAPRSCRSPGR